MVHAAQLCPLWSSLPQSECFRVACKSVLVVTKVCSLLMVHLGGLHIMESQLLWGLFLSLGLGRSKEGVTACSLLPVSHSLFQTMAYCDV